MKNKLYVCDMKDITIRVANNVEAEEVYKALHKEGIETDRLYRRTGRTTRIVDDAIQTLFTGTKLLIPPYFIKDKCLRTLIIELGYMVIYDHSVRTNYEQIALRDLIVNRLKAEHGESQFTVTNSQDGFTTVELK